MFATVDDESARLPLSCLISFKSFAYRLLTILHRFQHSGDMRPEYGSYKDHDPRPQPPLHLHALPKGHGPASSSTRISTVHSLSSLEYAPKFVKAVGAYDDLGRSLADGSGAEVIDGNGGVTEGEGLKFWKNLDLGPSRVGSPGTTPPVDSPHAIISTAGTTASTTNPAAEPEPLVRPTAAPLHVPQEQWFIRRALLANAQSRDASPSSTPEPRAATPSLASMLSDSLPPPPTDPRREEVEGFRPPAYFHLKPSNRGWRVLKNIGWDERGGLGRPSTDVEVRDGRGSEAAREGGVKAEDGVSRIRAADLGHRQIRTTGGTNESAIDLTLDSDSDSEIEQTPYRSKTSSPRSHSPNSPEPSSSRAMPSGRTAPVATYLKTDLRGIGALSAADKRRALLRPGTLAAPPSASAHRKRVTHSQDEIRRAVGDARASGEGLTGERRVQWEKKKGKRDAKRDREESARWRAAIDL